MTVNFHPKEVGIVKMCPKDFAIRHNAVVATGRSCTVLRADADCVVLWHS